MRAHRFTSLALAVAALAGAAVPLAGCTRQGMVDTVMTSAYRPPIEPRAGGASDILPSSATRSGARMKLAAFAGLELLAGDLHCHVSPPDDPSDVSRGLAETAELAASEGLDFVVLTPHVHARFAENEWLRAEVLGLEERLAGDAAAMSNDKTLFLPGFEYTDHRYGHVGTAFGDLAAVLREVPARAERAHRGLFFERWVASGGLLVVNHPLVTPLDSMFSMARADLSFRPWTSSAPVPSDIAAVERLAQAFEAYNVTVTHLRDRFLLGDADATLRATFAHLDGAIAREHRRMVPVGGSDSHGHYVRATTFVLAAARTPGAIRDAIVAGRTCVRDPAACSLEVRAAGGSWVGVGAELDGVSAIEARARGESIELIVDGAAVGSPASGVAARVTLAKDRCSVIRAHVDEGWSAPIYANCNLPARAAPSPALASAER